MEVKKKEKQKIESRDKIKTERKKDLQTYCNNLGRNQKLRKKERKKE